jgi:hypothetical protein
MLPPIVEHVDEGVAYFARRTEEPGVEAVCPDSSVATEHAVDCLGDADGEPLESARESYGRVRFDQQVQVIALDAEVDDAEASAGRRAQGAADG